jgi:tetratricopeptide (TPR) repeat protein
VSGRRPRHRPWISPWPLLLGLALAFCLPGLTTAAAETAAGTAEALIRQGDAHDRKLEATEALGFYDAAAKLEPRNVALLLSIARQYRHQAADAGSPGEKLRLGLAGKEYAGRALALAPSLSEAHLSVALSYAKMLPALPNRERVQAAREVRKSVDRALELDPGSDLGWHVLGAWHQRFAELGGMKRAVGGMLYGALPEASYEESARCFENAVRLNPNRAIHHVELGRTYAQMGRPDEARKSIEKGLKLPNSGKDDPEIKRRGRETLAGLK